jgi:histone deacetylase complex subunit SAP18
MSKRARDDDDDGGGAGSPAAARPPRREADGPELQRVDRDARCPFLLRVFWKEATHNSLAEYGAPGSGCVPGDEFQLYTWEDCSLRELADLFKNEHMRARRPRCQLSFAIVYPDKSGKNAMKEVGLVWSTNTNSTRHDAETKTLKDLHFQTGDFIDIAIQSSGGDARRTPFTPQTLSTRP